MPVFPDTREPVTGVTTAVAEADRIGYPVMVMAPAAVISGAIRAAEPRHKRIRPDLRLGLIFLLREHHAGGRRACPGECGWA